MSPLCQSLGFRIQEKLGSILFLGLPLARRFQMDVWVEMPLDGQKQDMSCSDVFHVMNVALLVAGFVAISPMMIHQIKGMTVVIMMREMNLFI